MKKRLFMLVISTVSAACLLCSGCGKSQEQQRADYYENELGLSKNEAQELAKDVQSELNGEKKSEQAPEGSQEGAEVVEYKLYPADAAWETMTVADKGLQIDDKMYAPGSTVEDVIKIVESSAEEYNYEYNPNKLITASNSEEIIIKKGDINWFYIQAYNYTEETMELSKCIVTGIFIESLEQNGILPFEYGRYVDGRSYQDFLKLSYSEVKELGNTIFKGYPMSEKSEGTMHNRYIEIEFDGDVDSVYTESQWSDLSLMTSNVFTFQIDPDTSKVTAFFCKGINGYGWLLAQGPYEPITSLAQVSRDLEEEIYNMQVNYLQENYPNCQVSFEGEAIQQEAFWGTPDTRSQQVTYKNSETYEVHNWNRLYKITKENGKVSYVCFHLDNARLSFTGKCIREKHTASDEMSYNEAIQQYFTSNIKDTTIQ